ncbi:AraC family transcriptional regulator [uncultured Roseobacter sp.]|uniref:AraC family transcriptional regulator n=1 Tax=uncultured Roseobacter sp. TaxID=114847 RepID=UPI0026218081|nr:AraC family transcriptional regulator [uncultured Roseobacter sp.]
MLPDPSEYLATHRLFQTQSVEEARQTVAQKFCDHRLELNTGSKGVAVRHNHVAGRATSLNYMTYGSDVAIDPGALQSFYLVQVPLSGQAHIRHRGTEVFADASRASVLNPDRETKMRWSHDCTKLLLQIDRSHLERVAQSLIGRELPGPIRFDPAIDLKAAGGRVIRRLIVACARAADDGALYQRDNNSRTDQIETELALALLTHHRNNISHIIETAHDAVLPRTLRRALEFIHANLVDPIDLTQIAGAAGISVRTLQLGFRDTFGATPMQYLRNARLDLAHYLLSARDDPVSVTEAAFSSGFSHLGRFSRDYKRRFGTAPSQMHRQPAATRAR